MQGSFILQAYKYIFNFEYFMYLNFIYFHVLFCQLFIVKFNRFKADCCNPRNGFGETKISADLHSSKQSTTA